MQQVKNSELMFHYSSEDFHCIFLCVKLPKKDSFFNYTIDKETWTFFFFKKLVPSNVYH